MIDLSNKIAVITGAGIGIGKGIATILANQGASIAIPDINLKDATQTINEIQSNGNEGIAIEMDVTKDESVKNAFKEIIDHFGQIDILVNNAGIYAAPGFEEYEEAREIDWDMAFNVNVKGLVFCTNAVKEQMKSRKYGKILNIASIAARLSNPQHLHYCATKSAVVNYTQGVARQLASYSINVNAICPGILWTNIWKVIATRQKKYNPEVSEDEIREIANKVIKEKIPMGREQVPEDIGKAVAFLVSDDASNITGQALHVDGGAVML